jgi:hypothetical protein
MHAGFLGLVDTDLAWNEHLVNVMAILPEAENIGGSRSFEE